MEEVDRSIDPVNIWLVEDNSHYRKSLAAVINITEGMICSETFSTCEVALKKMEGGKYPEIILLDIGLPGISGIRGIQKFKSYSPAIHIVILTIHEDNETVFDALCEGASGYLLKDSSQATIIESVKEVLSGRAPLNMRIAQKVLQLFARLNAKKTDYGLTNREEEILKHIVSGLTKQQIADVLFISFHTVNTHIKNIYKKLEVTTKAAVVSKAYKENLFYSNSKTYT